MDLSINETIRYNKSGPARYCCRPEVWSEIEKLLTPFGKRAIVSGGTRARASIQALNIRSTPLWARAV